MVVSQRARQVVADCERELEANFNLPAITIIGKHAARLCLGREAFEAIRAAVQKTDETASQENS